MIDTDKYEGHTPAPWRTAEGQPYDDEGSHLDIVDANGVLVTETSYFTDNDHPNAQLIADAPLILEAYKRLRELLESVIENAAEPSADNGYGYRFCEVDAELVEMIEEEMNRLVIE